jgi:hypothetical protein
MGALSSLATTGLNVALAQQAQAADAKRQAAGRDRQIKQILASDAESRRQSDAALQRQLAQQRARAGARGVGGVGGAIDAVTAGLTQETQAAQAARSAQAARRIQAIRDQYGSRRSSSLLDLGSQVLGGTTSLLGGLGGSRRSLLG